MLFISLSLNEFEIIIQFAFEWESKMRDVILDFSGKSSWKAWNLVIAFILSSLEPTQLNNLLTRNLPKATLSCFHIDLFAAFLFVDSPKCQGNDKPLPQPHHFRNYCNIIIGKILVIWTYAHVMSVILDKNTPKPIFCLITVMKPKVFKTFF